MELDDWGFDLATIIFVGTIVFGILGSYSLWSQNRRIWRMRSGVSVPVVTYTYMFASFLAGLIYGIADHRFALIFSSVLRVPIYIGILAGLKKFRGFTRGESILGVFLAAMIILMCFMVRKDLFFLAFMIGLVPKSLVQPWEMWKNKSSGAVDPVSLWVFVFSAVFWTFYWWATGGSLMFFLNILLFGIAILTLVLYYRYRSAHESTES